MKATRTLSMLALLALAGILAAAAPAASTAHKSLVIRHQVRGCHAWSLNGGAFKATQTAHLRAGSSMTVTNNDVMPHKLVELRGPAVVYTRVKAGMSAKGMGLKGTFPPAMLARMG